MLFSNTDIYIDISVDPEKRTKDHKYDSHNKQVKELFELGIVPEIIPLYDNLSCDEAVYYEKYCISKYRNDESFNCLNISDGGELGGGFRKWTKEICQEEALKYNNRSDFYKNSNGAYGAAHKQGWLEDICGHMEYLQKPKGYYTKELCREEALKYQTKSEFRNKAGSAANKAYEEGWYDEICSHMIEIKKPNGYWNDKERCQEEANKYQTRCEFQIKAAGAYDSVKDNGWLDDICGNMKSPQKPNGYWTKEICQEKSVKYHNKKTFKCSEDSAAYHASYKNCWLDEFFPKNNPF
jgi:hypothetical protein